MPTINKPKNKRFHLSPPQAITLSFFLMILVGTLLLCLPFASNDGKSVGFLNALFTATSANCVTGLVVVNTLTQWSLFGKLVILALIQLGGLGFISLLTLGMVFLRRKISLENRLLIQATYNHNDLGGMVRLVRFVIRSTIIFESIGAVLLAGGFFFSTPGMSPLRAVGMGIFHSISAFCNAGFDIIGPNSMMPYHGNWYINIVLMALIIVGGLGFTVWSEIVTRAKNRKAKRTMYQRWLFLSLHTKVVFLVTAVLLVLGAALFLLLEWNNPATLGPMPTDEKILAAFFQSTTLRTSGFNTIDQGAMSSPSKLLSCIYMFIGGSPAGTAGGIKTVTLGIIVIAMVSALRSKNKLEAFGRTLPLDLLQKALTVVGSLMIVVLTCTFTLYFTEMNSAFQPGLMDLLFESVSAAGTVGVTTGLTPHLSDAGKVVLSVCMFIGRIGPITAVVALNMRLKRDGQSVGYPSERVIIG